MTPRILLAGTGSGCGKTSMTCAILGALATRGEDVASFKCGPDYIDPMFHTKILGIPSRNLDSFLCGDETVKFLLHKNSAAHGLAVIEGVMGFYDGLSGTGTAASSYHLSQLTGTPVVLVVDCSGKSLSLAAEIQGYLRFRKNNIRAVLLNKVSPHAYPMYKQLVEEHCGVQVLGFLPKLPEAALESRHLGLVTAGEVRDIQAKIALLAEQAAQTIDLDALLALARDARELAVDEIAIPRLCEGVRIAVARDKAFCFYYEDNFDLLAELGAELVPFSPLEDAQLPEDIHGLLLGGGYPELYADRLSHNQSMLRGIKNAVNEGLPTIAECGGFLLLCRSLRTADGAEYSMAGALNANAWMTARLSRFGYVTLEAQEDNLLCEKGGTINAHSFHYSDSDNPGGGFVARKPGKDIQWPCIHTTGTLFAGYPHLHLWGNTGFAGRFIRACSARKGEQT